ncbi:hypothetical protein EDC04DRAFT_2599990 [Pisolithus marmoratus]|nr:hypothetical protein EDC04DRAFT_2599990 [Pisolithus marmoratus]
MASLENPIAVTPLPTQACLLSTAAGAHITLSRHISGSASKVPRWRWKGSSKDQPVGIGCALLTLSEVDAQDLARQYHTLWDLTTVGTVSWLSPHRGRCIPLSRECLGERDETRFDERKKKKSKNHEEIMRFGDGRFLTARANADLTVNTKTGDFSAAGTNQRRYSQNLGQDRTWGELSNVDRVYFHDMTASSRTPTAKCCRPYPLTYADTYSNSQQVCTQTVVTETPTSSLNLTLKASVFTNT